MNNLQEIRNALQSVDEETRRSALYSLRKFSCLDAQAIMFSAMGDESWRVRKEAVECYVCSNPDSSSILQLLNQFRDDENAGLRNSAAEAVIRLGSAAAAPLMSMVKDRDADVRKIVIDVMGAIGDRTFVPALIQALRDSELNVASAAAEQLGVLGDSNASEYLMQSIVARNEVLFSFSALGALRLLAKPAAVPDSLLKLADQDILRKAVFECLGSIADESSLLPLLNGFSCCQMSSRAAAVKALFQIYGRSSVSSQALIIEAVKALRETDTISGLLQLFDTHDGELTEALLWVSAVTKDTRFIPLLIEAYADERTADAALSSLKNFSRDALQEIIQQYSSLDENGRSCLCILISESGYSDFDTVIQVALRDPSALVRAAASVAVGGLGLSTMIPDLISLIDDNDANVYAAAVASLQSLVLISRTIISSEARKLCSSKLLHRRKAAALLLSSLGDMGCLQVLIHDEDPQVRKAAVAAIGVNHIDKSDSMLVLALSDTDADVRITAADALCFLQNPSCLEVVEQALNDDDVWVQSAVLKAIARIEPGRALSIIKKKLF